ncbi:MAG: sensor histidine kinase [Tumebacillaceae bacterium]
MNTHNNTSSLLHVIQAQEEERKQLSRNLHEGVGQALYSIMVGLRVIDHLPISEEIKQHLHEVQHLTVRTLKEVNHMSVELYPSALDDFGVVPALRSLAKRFEQSFDIALSLSISGIYRRYAPLVETSLYRICQEALKHAATHSDAKQIHMTFSDQGDCVTLQIKDNGLQITPQTRRTPENGLGLYGIRERANLLGGHMKIEPTPERGASITVTIPLDEKGGIPHVDSFADRG